eukprot:994708-Rhodomonas_salina.2
MRGAREVGIPAAGNTVSSFALSPLPLQVHVYPGTREKVHGPHLTGIIGFYLNTGVIASVRGNWRPVAKLVLR